MEPLHSLSTLSPPKRFEDLIRTQPGAFQLNLFDRSGGPTQLSLIAGSSAILTTEQWAELRSRANSRIYHTWGGPRTRMGLVGILDGVSLYLTTALPPEPSMS